MFNTSIRPSSAWREAREIWAWQVRQKAYEFGIAPPYECTIITNPTSRTRTMISNVRTICGLAVLAVIASPCSAGSPTCFNDRAKVDCSALITPFCSNAIGSRINSGDVMHRGFDAGRRENIIGFNSNSIGAVASPCYSAMSAIIRTCPLGGYVESGAGPQGPPIWKWRDRDEIKRAFGEVVVTVGNETAGSFA
ncbi:hypothetical protein FB451DRAFT_1175172 [Mycena latifolia]|nr:hypothetical protein FB451DRAFT_1175172 [Mycena latifolia]